MHKASYVHLPETLFNFILCYKRCFNWLKLYPQTISLALLTSIPSHLYLKNWYCQIAYYRTVVSWFTPCISTFSYHAIPAAKLFFNGCDNHSVWSHMNNVSVTPLTYIIYPIKRPDTHMYLMDLCMCEFSIVISLSSSYHWHVCTCAWMLVTWHCVSPNMGLSF